jgi:hypothetical protein
MEDKRPLQSIPDDELLRRLADILQQSRRVEAELVAHIGEVEGRKLYARDRDCTPARRPGRDAEAPPAGNDAARPLAGPGGECTVGRTLSGQSSRSAS